MAPDSSELTVPPVVNSQAYVGELNFWQDTVTLDGLLCGTEGRGLPLNGLRFSLAGNGVSGGDFFQCQPDEQRLAGLERKWRAKWKCGKRPSHSAIRLKLTGQAAEQYDIYYRVHSKTYGWLDWAKNGEPAGTEGLAKRLEAVEIRLVNKGGDAPGSTTRPFVTPAPVIVNGINYQTHVQTYGWQDWKANGGASGTSGEGKRLEAILPMECGAVSCLFSILCSLESGLAW